MTIAADRSLTRTAMRAATQRASLKQQNGQPREALALLEAPLSYFEKARHRRLEAVALTIAGRAHQDIGEYAQATTLLNRVLAFATESGNAELMAQARSSLATLSSSQGRLQEALEHRSESIRLRRELADTEILPYDLTNQVEVLIRMGRGTEAEAPLEELDAGIASGTGAFPTRVRRVALLRALRALTTGDYVAARSLAAAVDSGTPRPDETGQFAAALQAVAAAILGSRAVPAWSEGWSESSPGWRETRLWRALALLEAGQFAKARKAAQDLLAEGATRGGVEFEWRASSVIALAGSHLGDVEAPRHARQALDRFERLRREWGERAAAYETRRDVSRMLSAVGALR
jgi:tetratricopeptide (TPR) repeat protein